LANLWVARHWLKLLRLYKLRVERLLRVKLPRVLGGLRFRLPPLLVALVVVLPVK
jgi:hypothetical protein